MKKIINLPNLNYENFNKTRDTIHNFAIVLGKVREQLSPVQRDYWHISLRITPKGLTTTTIKTNNGREFEIILNLINHKIEIISSNKNYWSEDLVSLSVSGLIDLILLALTKMEIDVDLKNVPYEEKPGEYNLVHAENFWISYFCFFSVFSQFRKLIDFDLSPIQIWTHHLDIAFSYYTGKKVRDLKNRETENSEQITYGFLTGDNAINEPYLYVISYPEISNLTANKLDNDAFWYDGDWQGAILKYQDLYNSVNFEKKLLSFLIQTKKIFENELNNL